MGKASGTETGLKYSPQITTWIQVAFGIVAFSVQIVQITVAPSAQLYGTVSLLILASLAVIIVVFDYKRSDVHFGLRLLKATRKGAIDALEEMGESFLADAQSAGSAEESRAYSFAAKLVQRQASMLKKVR